jgi:hypothetical protein
MISETGKYIRGCLVAFAAATTYGGGFVRRYTQVTVLWRYCVVASVCVCVWHGNLWLPTKHPLSQIT